jgi:Tfp pilus assembly protein PilX
MSGRRGRLRDEGGWALVTAVLVSTLLFGVVLGGVSMVDAEQRQSVDERRRDTTFNLAESALNAQTFSLSGASWPGQTAAVRAACTGAGGTGCPDDAALRALHTSPDTVANTTWRTEIRDNGNGAGTFYSDALTAGQPGRDANGDDKVWVRAQATIGGRARAMVALVQITRRQVTIPFYALIAGSLINTNNGNKVLIDPRGANAIAAEVGVRCDPRDAPADTCLAHPYGRSTDIDDFLDGKIATQIPGVRPKVGLPVVDLLSAADREALKAAAKGAGTWYATCPSGAMPSGEIVYVETCDETYQANGAMNSAARPGMLIVERGTLTLRGTLTFHGLIYHANLARSSATLVDLGGDVQVVGGILVDALGRVAVGSSKENIVLDAKAFDVRVPEGAATIQSTWREIPTR